MTARSPGRFPRLSTRGGVVLIATSALVVLLLVGPPTLNMYVDWLWFGEVGFRSVWLTVLLTKVATFAVVTLLVGGATLAAMLLAYRTRRYWSQSADPTIRSARIAPR